MKKYTWKLNKMVLFALLGAASGLAYASDGIVKDADGNYVITYSERLSRGTFHMLFIPATKIAPSVRSSWRLEDNIINYRYRIHNGGSAKQYLDAILVEPISSLITTPSILPKSTDQLAYSHTLTEAARNSMRGPKGWETDIIDIPSGFRLAWDIASKDPDVSSGFPPGTGSDDFGYRSQDLPGVAVMELTGCVIYPPDMWTKYDTDEMLDPTLDVVKQFQAMRKNNFVPRNAAVPTIAVPVPFDAAVLLDRIRTHVATWPSKQLAEPAYAAQLDRYLVAAANAYRLNNAKAGKEHIETLRKMLAKEHRYLDHDDEDNDDTEERKAHTRFTIDRLAARVLDFDLRYVLKRIEHDHEEGDRKKER